MLASFGRDSAAVVLDVEAAFPGDFSSGGVGPYIPVVDGRPDCSDSNRRDSSVVRFPCPAGLLAGRGNFARPAFLPILVLLDDVSVDGDLGVVRAIFR